MKAFILAILLIPIVAFGQGPVRWAPNLPRLLATNPYQVATGQGLAYEVGQPSTNGYWGRSRLAVWLPSTNLVSNGTNVFNSQFGGQWWFPDADDPIQDARWYGLTNRWSLDHLGNLVIHGTNVINHLGTKSPTNHTHVIADTVGLNGELDSKSSINHTHVIDDVTDSTSTGRLLVKSSAPSAARTVIGLGDSATRNVGTSAGTVAEGDHNHDGLYDPIGRSMADMLDHLAGIYPHDEFVLIESGMANSLTASNMVVTSPITFENMGSDLASGGGHRIMVRDATSHKIMPMTPAYLLGLMDPHADDIAGTSVFSQSIMEAADIAELLTLIGSGTPGTNTYLRGDGTWATPPSSGSATNGIMDAPSDGTTYARKDAAWVGIDIDMVSGLTAFGNEWVTMMSDEVDALARLQLTGLGAATIDSPAKHSTRVNSGTASIRHGINIIGATGISVSVFDDAVDDESDVTIGLSNMDRGDITTSASGSVMTIDSGSVSYAKMQTASAGKILGRRSGASGAIEELTPGTGLEVTSGGVVNVTPSAQSVIGVWFTLDPDGSVNAISGNLVSVTDDLGGIPASTRSYTIVHNRGVWNGGVITIESTQSTVDTPIPYIISGSATINQMQIMIYGMGGDPDAHPSKVNLILF